MDVSTPRSLVRPDGGAGSDRARNTFSMSMRNFFIALAITAVFLGILLVAGTAQNEGCLPWKEPITVGGGGLLRSTGAPSSASSSSRRSGAGVEPTEPWATRPHEF